MKAIPCAKTRFSSKVTCVGEKTIVETQSQLPGFDPEFRSQVVDELAARSPLIFQVFAEVVRVFQEYFIEDVEYAEKQAQ